MVKRTSTEKEKDELRAKGDITIKQSDSQKDAYIPIDGAKGFSVKDNTLYVFGTRIKKTVLIPIEYPTTNSAIKTVIKNSIKKSAQLRGDYTRRFKLGSLETLKIQGQTINI